MSDSGTGHTGDSHRLTMPRQEVEHCLKTQIYLGESLLAEETSERDALLETTERYINWNDTTKDMLARMFETSWFLDQYTAFDSGALALRPSLRNLSLSLHNDIERCLEKLRDIVSQLGLCEEPPSEPVEIHTNDPEVPETGAEDSGICVLYDFEDAHLLEVRKLVSTMRVPARWHNIFVLTNEDLKTAMEDLNGETDVVLVLSSPSEESATDTGQLCSQAGQLFLFMIGYLTARGDRVRSAVLYADKERPALFHRVCPCIPLQNSEAVRRIIYDMKECSAPTR